jgi:malonyl-CoA O-methyltransferase
MSLFVLGTDTGVGKTLVSALLLARYRESRQLVYWKPIATGARDERDRETVDALVPGIVSAAETYLYDEPVSPHLAAEREGEPIEITRISKRWRELRTIFAEAGFVVEGAGGLLVPLDADGTLLVDLAAAMALPVLLVGRSTLGTINHTLLSLEALRARAIQIAGVVLSGPRQPENVDAIERFGDVAVLGELEPLTTVGAAEVAAAALGFDEAGLLEPYLAGGDQPSSENLTDRL